MAKIWGKIFILWLICSLRCVNAVNLWLDCDPGIDDVFAIILAGLHPQINLLGVSSSLGNIALNYTTDNANQILSSIGRTDISVYRGTDKQIKKTKSQNAAHIHGQNGLGGVQFPKSPKPVIIDRSFQQIVQKINNYSDKVTLVIVGPETNWCHILKEFPEVKQNIEKIVIMGGAIGYGNVSPAAEFNIHADADATKCVLQNKGSIPFVMVPLQVTLKVQAKQQFFNFLSKNKDKSVFVSKLLQILTVYKKTNRQYDNIDWPAIHDPNAVYYALFPDQFESKQANIIVDVYQTSYGRTNCYFGNQINPLSSIDKVALKLKRPQKFWQTMQKMILKVISNNKKNHRLIRRNYEY